MEWQHMVSLRIQHLFAIAWGVILLLWLPVYAENYAFTHKRYQKALKLARQGEIEKGALILTELILSNPQNNYLNDFVTLLVWKGEWEKAINFFEHYHLYNDAPNYLLLDIALAYENIGATKEALAYYNECLLKGYQVRLAIEGMVRTYVSDGNVAAASFYISSPKVTSITREDFRNKLRLWLLSKEGKTNKLPRMLHQLDYKGSDSLSDSFDIEIIQSLISILFKKHFFEKTLIVSSPYGFVNELLNYPIISGRWNKRDIPFHIAKSLMDLGNIEAALDWVNIFLKEHPDHVEGLYLKGEIQERLGVSMGAVDSYDKLKTIIPMTRAPRDLSIRKYLEKGALSLAINELIEHDYDVDQVILERIWGDIAMYRLRWKEPQKAKDIIEYIFLSYQDLIGGIPINQNFEASGRFAFKKLLENKKVIQHEFFQGLDDSELTFRNILTNRESLSFNLLDLIMDDLVPGKGLFLRLMWDYIISLHYLERYELILEAYEKILPFEVAIPEWIIEIVAGAYLSERYPKKALELYLEVVEKSKSFNAKLGLYHTWVELARFDKAFKVLEELHLETPEKKWFRGIYRENWDKAELYFNEYWFLMYQNKLRKAYQQIKLHFHEASNNTHFRNVLAHLYLWRGWPRKALKEFEVIHTLDPDNLQAHNGMIEALRALGRIDEGKKTLSNLLSKHPKSKALTKTKRRLEVKARPYITTDFIFNDEHPGPKESFFEMYFKVPIHHRWEVYTGYINRNFSQSLLDGQKDKNYTGIKYFQGDIASINLAFSYSSHDKAGGLVEGFLNLNDFWSIGIELENKIFDIPIRSQELETKADDYSVWLSFNLNESFQNFFRYTYRNYSDGNNHESFYFKQAFGIKDGFFFNLGLDHEVDFSQNSRNDVPYYSPPWVFQYYIIPRFRINWLQRYSRLFATYIDLGVGFQKQRDFDWETLTLGRIEFDFSLNDITHILLGYERSRKSYDGEKVDMDAFYLTFKKRF